MTIFANFILVFFMVLHPLPSCDVVTSSTTVPAHWGHAITSLQRKIILLSEHCHLSQRDSSDLKISI